MVTVYSHPTRTTYHANALSCATFLLFCVFVVIIIIPFVVAYAMDEFWLKESFITYRPKVKFRYEALVEAYDQNSKHLGWSTSFETNNALATQDQFRSMELRAWNDDDNRDGTPEQLHFKLSVPLDAAAGQQIRQISLLVGLEARRALAPAPSHTCARPACRGRGRPSRRRSSRGTSTSRSC